MMRTTGCGRNRIKSFTTHTCINVELPFNLGSTKQKSRRNFDQFHNFGRRRHEIGWKRSGVSQDLRSVTVKTNEFKAIVQ